MLAVGNVDDRLKTPSPISNGVISSQHPSTQRRRRQPQIAGSFLDSIGRSFQ